MPSKDVKHLHLGRLSLEVHDAQTRRLEHLTRIEILRSFTKHEGTVTLGLNSRGQEQQGRENKTGTWEGNIEHGNPY